MTDTTKPNGFRNGKADRFFIVSCVVGTLLLNAVVFGYLYGTLETKVATHESALSIMTQDIKGIPERLARIETILQQLVNK